MNLNTHDLQQIYNENNNKSEPQMLPKKAYGK